MIREGATFTALQIDPGRMHVLGTPTQLQTWSVAQLPPRVTPLRVCFDLDCTLLAAPSIPGDYATCVPIEDNVACLRALHAQGHTIILLTERGMASSGGSVGAAVADVAAATLASLTKHKIPYHELCFGKPVAQLDAKVEGSTSGAAHLAALVELNRRTAEEQTMWAAEHAKRTQQRKEIYLARIDRENAIGGAQPNSDGS
jgi:hypothetical protein